MRRGMFWLVVAYMLSQFYRAFLAVIAPALDRDIGVGAPDISQALGLWFLCFAAMQIPVGWALDTYAPRRVAALLLGVAGTSGALVFALATGPLGVKAAMVLIGIGCSPVLMTAYYLVARIAPPERFGTLAGLVLGLGMLGNVVASAPLSLLVAAAGWRGTMAALAGITALVSLAVYTRVVDPPRIATQPAARRGSLRDVLGLRALWPIFALALVSYAPAAGLRGSWAGPYFSNVHGLDAIGVGNATLVMACAMIAGSFAWGASDRLFRSRKSVIIVGNLCAIATLAALWQGVGTHGAAGAMALFAALGFFASSSPQIANQGRAVLPVALTGRGLTMINLCSIGGVGLLQLIAGRVFEAGGGESYSPVFGFFAIMLALGLAAFLFSRDQARHGASATQ